MKDAIEPASSEPSFYSRLIVTPKVTGGWRPVIDLSRLNRFVRFSHFHMESSLSVLHSLCPGDWMVSIDLQDAYLQVPVHPESRRFLRFCLGHQTFQFRVLCFDLSSAPQVFTRVMAPISSIRHRFGYRILRYLDDWLVLGSSFQEITRVRDFLLWLCRELGPQVNLSKSSLTPTQTLDYLGMTLQSTPLRAFPTQARVRKVLSLIEEFCSSREQPLSLAFSSGSHVLDVHTRSRILAPDEVIAAPPQRCGSSVVRGRAGLLGRLLPPGSSLVVHCQPSRGRSLPRSSSPESSPLHGRIGLRLGCFARRRPSVRLMVSSYFEIFSQSPGTSSDSFSGPWFSPSAPGSVSLTLHRQYHCSGVSGQGGRHSFFQPQYGSSSYPSPLRSERSTSAPPICSGTSQRSCRFPESGIPSSGLRMDCVRRSVRSCSVVGRSPSTCSRPPSTITFRFNFP